MDKRQGLFYLVINKGSGQILSKGICAGSINELLKLRESKHLCKVVNRKQYDSVEDFPSRIYYWNFIKSKVFYRSLLSRVPDSRSKAS